MALKATEQLVAGFIRVDGALALTTDETSATMQRGFLRDPDGRLVVQRI